MIRKRNDSDGYRRGAMGIDDDRAGRFTKQNRTDPWEVRPNSSVEGAKGDGVRKVDTVKSAGQNYTSNDSGLRQKPQGAGTGDTHDIFDNVERNSNVSKTGGPGPIKYGVD